MDIHGEFVPAMGIPPTKITSMILGKHIYILYIYCTSFSWESFDLIFDPFQQIAARSFVGWMNGLNKKYQESLVGKGNMQTYTQAGKVSATYHTDSIWQQKYAEICWNETICSRLWRSPCLGSQFWCQKNIKKKLSMNPWTHHFRSFYGLMTSVLFKVKHPNFGGHSGALVPVIYLRSRFRNAGDAVADFPGNTEKKYFIYNFIILYIYCIL